MNFVILAGGVGERLWPLGTPQKPKQFHVLVGDEPLIVQAVARLDGIAEPVPSEARDLAKAPRNDIYFSTSEPYVHAIRALFPEITNDQFIIEPVRRDTGPAMAYVAARLMDSAPDEPVAFIPADHTIGDVERFRATLRVAEQLIRETGKMIDIGVPAEFPSTVLGYTHIGKKLEERDEVAVYEFLGHTEKPILKIAEQYCASGEYLWHANYYMWTPRKIMEALQRYAPELYDGILRALKDPRAYETLEKISFDYAITEHMDPKDVLILKGDFDWSDVGAWDVLYNKLASAPGENVTRGPVTALDCEGSLIYSTGNRTIGAVGLKNMVVVDTPNGVLVCPKDRAQEVKRLVAELQKKSNA